MPRPILFPLGASSLVQPVLLQQRSRAFGNLVAPTLPANRPWNAAISRYGAATPKPTYPSVVHQLLPMPPTSFRITGTTKDSTGAALGNCVVDWFRTSDDVKLDTTTSDANGLFEFRTAGQPPNAYYLVAYLAGTTDVAGTTVNTLVGT